MPIDINRISFQRYKYIKAYRQQSYAIINDTNI